MPPIKKYRLKVKKWKEVEGAERRKEEEEYDHSRVYACAQMSQCKALIFTTVISYNKEKAGSGERTDQERQALTTYQRHNESSYKYSTVDTC